jgi:broad specificity phosphatase PhoE
VKLTIIRHLPTEWNRKGLLQGKRDISIQFPIEEEQANEIEKNKFVLDSCSYNRILTSELIRTQETATLYSYSNYTKDVLLNELDFGIYEGKEKVTLLRNEAWLRSPRQLELGESLLSFERRIKNFLKKYKNDHHILVFGHGSWIRALLSIKELGTVDRMNTLTVKNNELVVVAFEREEIEML